MCKVQTKKNETSLWATYPPQLAKLYFGQWPELIEP